ncbi:hypothetical protein QE152_g8705 [Popillia japonica]|uniref:Insulin-like peptide 7 n=1 Tax=Popillia japonica TaxID=7064 RepID=A0AAW1M5L2_POPJA
MVAFLSMFFPVSTFAALCVFIEVSDGSRASDNELDTVFRERTNTQWADAWHREKFVRCRQALVDHLYWACEKDIYRITRRSKPTSHPIYTKIDFPWLTKRDALVYLRYRRGYGLRSGPSITSECCRSSGCTWEEYAEYCPFNKRYV